MSKTQTLARKSNVNNVYGMVLFIFTLKKQENLSIVLWDAIALSFGVEEGSSGC